MFDAREVHAGRDRRTRVGTPVPLYCIGPRDAVLAIEQRRNSRTAQVKVNHALELSGDEHIARRVDRNGSPLVIARISEALAHEVNGVSADPSVAKRKLARNANAPMSRSERKGMPMEGPPAAQR